MQFDSGHRQRVLQAAAIGIIVYSIFVLFWANMVPYLGINVFGNHLVSLDAEPVSGPTPKIGDRILSLGVAGRIHTWPDYLHSLHHLGEKFRDPQKIDNLAQLATATHPDAIDESGNRFVRAAFEGAGGTYYSWFQVRYLPWQRTAVSALWAAVQAGLFGLGWLVSRRRPTDDAAALFFLNCILTVGAYLGGHHWFELSSQPSLIFVFAICAMALPQVNLHFYLLFPTPKRWVMRHPRTVIVLLYVLPGMLQIAVLTSIGGVFSAFRFDQSAVELLQERLAWMRLCVWSYVAVSGVMFAGCIAAMMHSYRAARRPLPRNQMRWILFGALVASLFVAYSLFLAWRDPVGVALGRATWAMFASSLAFTAAHAVAIARYRLTDAGAVVERSRLYLAVSFLGSLLYYGVLFLLAFVSPHLAGVTNRPEGLLVSSSIIFVLLVANTVRTNVQKIVDRRFFREKHRLDRAMRRLGEAVGKLSAADAVWKRVLDIAVDTLNATGGAVYRAADGDLMRAEAVGALRMPEKLGRDEPLTVALAAGGLLQTNVGPMLPGDAHSLPLKRLGVEIAQPILHDGKLLGCLLLASRGEGRYNADELTFLAGFADLAAVALHRDAEQALLERLNRDLKEKIEKLTANQVRLETMRRAALETRSEGDDEFGEMRGVSPAIRQLLASVRKVAASQATVLVRGESGTGKTLLAELIHKHSPRKAEPFVPVHCAALSPGVLESELFGHVKGAFTSAHKDKVGRFQTADRGTLFLDEIGDISLETQTKLLRVLQAMTFEPVGSSATRKVDVRVIAATNQPLEQLIAAGRFREDLYYRLNVIGLSTPALRERPEDVLPLAEYFLKRAVERLQKPVEGFTDAAAEALLAHAWPGNVRELQNVVERSVVMAEDATIDLGDLPQEVLLFDKPTPHKLRPTRARKSSVGRLRIHESDSASGLAAELGDLERQRLLDALAAADGNKTAAAHALGYRRTTFCSKLKKYGIG